MDPKTLELLRSLQSGSHDASDLSRIFDLLSTQRVSLREQGDLATLAEISELLEVWASAATDARSSARAMLCAVDLAEHELGQAGRAAEIFARAMRNAADGGDEAAGRSLVYCALGENRTAAKDLDGAIAAYEEALDADADPKVIQRLADAFARRAQTGDAEQAADLYCTLGEVLGNPEGVSMLERALDLQPHHAEAAALLEQYLSARAQRARSGRTVVGYKLPADPDEQMSLTTLDGKHIPPSQPPESAGDDLPQVHVAPAPAVPAIAAVQPTKIASKPAAPISKPVSAPPLTARPSVASRVTPVSATPSSAPARRASWDAPAPMGSVPVATRRSSTSVAPRASAPSVAPRASVPAVAPRASVPSVAARSSYPAPASMAAVAPRASMPAATATVHALKPAPGAVLETVPSLQAKPSASPSMQPPPAVEIDDDIPAPPSRWRGKGKLIGGALAACAIAAAAFAMMQKPTPAAAPLPASQPTTSTAAAVPAPVPVPAVEPVKPEPLPATAEAATTDKPSEPAAVSGEPAKAAEPAKKSKPEPNVKPLLKQAVLRGGKLDASDFAAAIEKLTPKVERCYTQALKKKPKTDGRITVGFNVRTNGRAVAVRKVSGTINDAVLTRCTVNAISSTHFPKPRKKTASVKVPFEYNKA